jgi:PAT family beta-lactamase induction signal transducer AmpG
MFGIFLAGPIADRIGPQRTNVLVLAAMAVLQLAMAAAGPLWSAPHVFASYKVVYILLFVLLSVSVYALAMRTSLPAVAATQFSIFMAILNLGTSFGSKLFASVKPAFDYEGVFVAGAICAFLAALMFRRRPARGD